MDSPAADSDADGQGIDVVCIGHAAFDSVYGIDRFPPRPLKVKALRFDESVGGMAANAACAIARLGGRVAFWGPLGDDAVARRIRDEFVAAGVDAGRAFTVAGAFSSHSAIVVDARGERLIISHRGDALAYAGPLEEPLAAKAVLVDVRWNAGALAMAARYREQGVPVIVDGEMGNAVLLRELAPHADHLIFSENGYAEWAGVRHASGVDIVHLQDLVARGATLAAVTCGERGVWYAHRWGAGHMPAFPVNAVETLGAGDVFHGAYALAVATGCMRPVPLPDEIEGNAGQPARRNAGTPAPAGPTGNEAARWNPAMMGRSQLESALAFASAAAALKCMRHGGRLAMPALEQVQEFIDKHAAGARPRC